MITIAFLTLSLAAALFVVRLIRGPSVPDRVIALDGLLITVMCGVLLAAAWEESPIGIDTVPVVALLGFVGTGAIARYVEQRGGR